MFPEVKLVFEHFSLDHCSKAVSYYYNISSFLKILIYILECQGALPVCRNTRI